VGGGPCVECSVRLTIEAFNPKDHPGYLIATQEDAAAVVTSTWGERTGVQVDIYHCHEAAGNAVATLRRLRDDVAHVQIADAPDRAEPGTGEIDFPEVFATLDDIDYRGWVGCEYHPRRSTIDGSVWRETLL
jgi:hydroxypyruvate isomerase